MDMAYFRSVAAAGHGYFRREGILKGLREAFPNREDAYFNIQVHSRSITTGYRCNRLTYLLLQKNTTTNSWEFQTPEPLEDVRNFLSSHWVTIAGINSDTSG